ncbi:MAG: hypothetical protein IBX64_02515 [Actinobacteria bacterium]|nr:hypothetical protein [Actinomycetota bacterium]
MKFLVIDRGGTIDVTVVAAEDLFTRARDWVKEMTDKGKIETAYALAGEMASVIIFNADSHEELDDMLQDYPLSNYSVFEVYPLSDALHSYEKAAQAFAQRRQQLAA